MLHILEPIVPHICWELSEKYFKLSNFKYIVVDEAALIKEQITYAITINGKKRAEMEVPLNLTNEELISQAKQNVEKWLQETQILKEIIVPKKLVNFVVK